jgi:hypothetical protein
LSPTYAHLSALAASETMIVVDAPGGAPDPTRHRVADRPLIRRLQQLVGADGGRAGGIHSSDLREGFHHEATGERVGFCIIALG